MSDYTKLPARVILGRGGELLANGQVIGRWQHLKIGGYEFTVHGRKYQQETQQLVRQAVQVIVAEVGNGIPKESPEAQRVPSARQAPQRTDGSPAA